MLDIPKSLTNEVPWDQIRESAKTRRANVAAAWGLQQDESVVIPVGEEIPKRKGDQTHPFCPDPDFFYLTGGRKKPGEVLVFDPQGGWTLFFKPQDSGMVVWEGSVPPPEDTGIDQVLPLEQLQGWLEARKGQKVIVLDQDSVPDGFDGMPPEFTTPKPSRLHRENEKELGLVFDPERWRDAQRTMNAARMKKDSIELGLIHRAVDVTRAAFAELLRYNFAGRTEREIVDFIDGFMRARGAQRLAFDTIAGHGAILHGAPTNRRIDSNGVVLVDAGAEVDGYCGDVTRVFPAGRQFVGMHRDLYAAVLAAQEAAIRDIRTGVEFRDLHKATVERMAQNLIDIGILKGNAQDRVEDGSCELFFPHGLGHPLGIHVHDLQRYTAPGRKPSLSEPGKRKCKVDFPIESGQTFTIEPGIYFAPWLFTPEIRTQFCDAVDWTKVDALLATGNCGFRIEDDIFVDNKGPIILTEGIPKEIDEIEAARTT